MKSYKLFAKNPDKLEELKTLLEKGHSYLSLAKYFGVDHSSIIYRARKLGYPSSHRAFFHHRKTPTLAKLYPKDGKLYPLKDILLGDKINPGHSYKEYQAIENKKKKGGTLEEIVKRKLVYQ